MDDQFHDNDLTGLKALHFLKLQMNKHTISSSSDQVLRQEEERRRSQEESIGEVG